jgi:hypothetical protein
MCAATSIPGIPVDKPTLRNALKKLRALPLDEAHHHNVMMAPQEMLDYLALLNGQKPVYLLGRGFDDPAWVTGALAMATKAGLHIIEGPQWDAQESDKSMPSWFREHLDAQNPTALVFYVCRTKATAEAVQATIDNPPITMDEEARLLGYPACCVKAHYERQAKFNKVFYQLVKRAAGGDETEMKRILEEDIEVAAETPEEEAAMKEAQEFEPALYTSFHMCVACAGDENSAARKLSKQYEALANEIDKDLAAQIKKNQQGVDNTSRVVNAGIAASSLQSALLHCLLRRQLRRASSDSGMSERSASARSCQDRRLLRSPCKRGPLRSSR